MLHRQQLQGEVKVEYSRPAPHPDFFTQYMYYEAEGEVR